MRMNAKFFIVAAVVFVSFFGLGRMALAAALDSGAGATPSAVPITAAVPATQTPSSSAIENSPAGAEQRWNFHIQNTDVEQGDPGFAAKFSGPHSLNSNGDSQETVSLDLFAGVRLW